MTEHEREIFEMARMIARKHVDGSTTCIVGCPVHELNYLFAMLDERRDDAA